MPNHIHAIIPVGATLAVARHGYDIAADDIPVGAALVVARHGSDIAADDIPVEAALVVARHGSDIGADTKRAGASPAPTENTKTENTKFITIGDIVVAYKSLVANSCLKIYKYKNERMGKLWQRNYFEHIIRNVTSLYFIRNYIRNNPLNWLGDKENHIDKEIFKFAMTEIGETHAPKSFH
jgi:hypothetical protein